MIQAIKQIIQPPSKSRTRCPIQSKKKVMAITTTHPSIAMKYAKLGRHDAPPKAAKFVSSSMNAPIGVRRRRVHSVTRKPANAFGATTHAPPMTKNAKTKRFGHA